MPIYEYACRDCGHTIEVMLGLKDRQPRKCRECSGRLEKQISRTSFQLKGGGWFDHGYSKGSGSGGNSKPSISTSASTSNGSKDKGKKKSSA